MLVVLLSVLVIGNSASPAASPPHVLHALPALPRSWQIRSNDVLDDHPILVRFSLKQNGLDELKKIASRVSDPRSPSYGEYLSASEVRTLTAPSPARARIVESWLQVADVPFRRLAHGQILEATLSASKARRVFKTRFHQVSNLGTSQHVVRAEDYWLPAEVHDAVAAVYGLHGLPVPPQDALRSVPSKPVNVTPSVIKATYNIYGVHPSGSTIDRQAVAEFQGQRTATQDLKDFFTSYVPKAPIADAKVYKFVGDIGKGEPGIEAELDTQYIMGVAPGILTEFWYLNGFDFCGSLKNWTEMVLKDDDPPLVHSVSYGWQGSLEELGCTTAEINDVDGNFVKLAAQGITIIIASGDAGSGYIPDCGPDAVIQNLSVEGTASWSVEANQADDCCAYTRDNITAWTFTPPPSAAGSPPIGKCSYYKAISGTKPQPGAVSGGDAVKPHLPKLYPSWPASSPWVTSVGATRFVDQKVGNAEMASDQFGSGGGFSPLFDAFSDQAALVKEYLQTAPGLPPKGSFPPGGRATPDVSALGEGFQVFTDGVVGVVGGTAASTPTFAATVSLLNEARRKVGKKPMGYLNPFLYQNADCFTDITVGTNAIGNRASPLQYGYECVKGWDPATGLGTPIFNKLLVAALAAGPPPNVTATSELLV